MYYLYYNEDRNILIITTNDNYLQEFFSDDDRYSVYLVSMWTKPIENVDDFMKWFKHTKENGNWNRRYQYEFNRNLESMVLFAVGYFQFNDDDVDKIFKTFNLSRRKYNELFEDECVFCSYANNDEDEDLFYDEEVYEVDTPYYGDEEARQNERNRVLRETPQIEFDEDDVEELNHSIGIDEEMFFCDYDVGDYVSYSSVPLGLRQFVSEVSTRQHVPFYDALNRVTELYHNRIRYRDIEQTEVDSE